MKSLLTAALSCFLSLLLFRFVVATSPPAPAPSVAAPAAAPQATNEQTPPPQPSLSSSLLGFLFSPAPRSPLSSLYVTNPTLPIRPLRENGCIPKSVQMAEACR